MDFLSSKNFDCMVARAYRALDGSHYFDCVHTMQKNHKRKLKVTSIVPT